MAYKRLITMEEKYTRALQIADFILEGGHLVEDVLKEFKICKGTYLAYMRFLCTYGYGVNLRENQILYLRTRNALNNEKIRRLREKRE